MLISRTKFQHPSFQLLFQGAAPGSGMPARMEADVGHLQAHVSTHMLAVFKGVVQDLCQVSADT